MPIPSSSPWVAAPRTRPVSGRRAVRLHGLLAMLLALSVAALVVAADRLIHHWNDGHLFLGWVALWMVIFAATALLDSWSRCRVPTRRSEPLAATEATAHAGHPTPPEPPLDASRHGGFLPYL